MKNRTLQGKLQNLKGKFLYRYHCKHSGSVHVNYKRGYITTTTTTPELLYIKSVHFTPPLSSPSPSLPLPHYLPCSPTPPPPPPPPPTHTHTHAHTHAHTSSFCIFVMYILCIVHVSQWQLSHVDTLSKCMYVHDNMLIDICRYMILLIGVNL